MRPKEWNNEKNPVSTNRKKWIKFGPYMGTLAYRQGGKWNCTREGFFYGSMLYSERKMKFFFFLTNGRNRPQTEQSPRWIPQKICNKN
jgi:hypothetical protein